MENISFEEIKEILRENALGMAELRQSQKETDAMFKETRAQMKETDARFKKTETLISDIGKQMGGISNNNGYFAEQFFAQSLKEKKSIGGINFDEVETNLKHKRRGVTDEFDIVLYNGDSVGIVEVKYVADKGDLTTLMERKAPNFRILYPEYADYKLYLGLAGLSFLNEDVKRQGIAAGVAILEAKGDHAEITADNMKVF